ncbi:hypothetical protein ACJDT4_23095 [Clostridium neuense]|uniref:ABC transporter permease n=1 Tax=Clostridium neuense TaxID=1728934 RepID=A0ABW8TPA5_9CLOT
MKEFAFLKFLDMFSTAFGKMGIDYKIMRRLIQIKLTLDKRRPSNLFQGRKRKKSNENSDYTLFLYGFIGLMFSMTIFTSTNIFVKTSIITGIILFMVMTSLISDFSSVLLDVKDKSILSPRAVSSKTINAAKVIHIAYYLMKATFVVSIFSMIFGTIKYGPMFLIIFLVEDVFMMGFILFFTSILYFIILCFFDGEKLKDIINYLQIVLAVAVLVIYQLMGKIMNISETGGYHEVKAWTYLIPSSWFGSVFSVLIEGQRQTPYIVLALMGILIPIIAFIIYVKFISVYFEKNLSKLINSDRGNKKLRKSGGIGDKILNIICPNKVQKQFFRFASNMISTERRLKLTIYPYLVFGAVLPFVFVFNINATMSGAAVLNKIANGKYYFGVYYTLACASMSIVYMGRSEKFKGAWIYDVLPIEDMSQIYKGATKAFFFKLMFPITLLTNLVFLVLCGVKILPDVIAMMINLVLLVLVSIKISPKELPFSRDFTNKYSAGSAFGFMILTAVLGVIHYLATRVSFGIWVYIAIIVVAIVVLWNNAFKFEVKKL